MKTNNTTFLTKKWHLLLLSVVISIVLGAGGHFYFSHSVRQLRLEKENDLKAITELKINQLVQWHKERIADAKVISESPFFEKGIEEWLENKFSKPLKADILERINSAKINYGYDNIFLISKVGDILLSNIQSEKKCETTILPKIYKASSSGKITLTDFYFCSAHNKIHFDIIAPIKNESNIIIANLIFRVDPFEYLYPLIQSWPTLSKTAETLLLKKVGDSVLYLNKLRHQKNTALQLHLPLTRKDLPAVQAALGKTGIFDGKDYRGVDVLAYLSPVPETDWFMVAKVDTDEIFAEIYFLAIISFIIIFLLILSLTIGIVWIYYYRQRNIYRNLWQTQEEFSITIKSIGDAVITTDKKGNVKYFNPVAEQLTGWNVADANGKQLEKVFKIINEETRDIVENPVERVLREGVVVGLANHSILISKDGTERPIADSGAPIKNEKGEIVGVVLVFRDQSEERAIQKALHDSEARLKLSLEVNHTGVWELNLLDLTTQRTLAHDQIFGYETLLPSWTFEMFLEHVLLEDHLSVEHSFREARAAQSDWSFECRIRRTDNEVRWIYSRGSHIRNSEGKFVKMLGIVQDITERKQIEEEAKKQSELLQRIIDNIPVMITCFDETGKIQLINRVLVEKLGWTLEEWQTQNILAKCYPEPEVLKEALDFMISKPGGWKDFKTTTKYGTVLDTTWTNILRPDGLSMGIGQDISDRKLAEEEIKLNNLRLHYLLELHKLVDAPQKQVLDFVNEAISKSIQSPFAFIGLLDETESVMTIHAWSKYAMEKCAIDERPINYSISDSGIWGNCVKQRKAIIINRYEDTHPNKKRYPAGHVPIKRFLAIPVFDGDKIVAVAAAANKEEDYSESDIVAFTAIMNKTWEIIQRKRAEEKLRSAQERYRSFFEDDLTGDFISTPAGQIVICNPAFAHMFGFSSVDEAKGVNVQTLYSNPNDRTVLLERLQKKEIIKYLEIEMKQRDGTSIFIVANLSGIFNDQGELVQIKGYLFNDTKRRLLEHQLMQTKKLESLGTLAAGIAHDFNNILGIIIGHASIFERLPATPDMIKKNTEAIIKAGMRGANLVKQMLTFARKTDVRFESLQLNDTVKEVSKLLNETFPKTIIISIHLDEELPLIEADATQVHQVILNLCVNARDAMQSRGTLTITTHRESGKVLREKYFNAIAEDYIILSIADTGMGMDEETQSRIFEPFFTTKEHGKGTGLGLSLVFGIMESHKGFVTVESELGKGTTIHCYFPMLQKTIKVAPVKEQSTENIPGGNETILVIEDEEALRELVKSVFKLKGYTVLTAGDGEEGITIFAQHQDEIRLVLSDFGLPKFSGDEVYQKLKRLQPNVLFILASGFIEPGMKSEIFNLGIKRIIQKPYNTNHLLRIVRDLLDNRKRTIDSE